jgi:hypothetical protein
MLPSMIATTSLFDGAASAGVDALPVLGLGCLVLAAGVTGFVFLALVGQLLVEIGSAEWREDFEADLSDAWEYLRRFGK